MKKRLISAALVLLLMCILAPAGFADMTYQDPPAIVLGNELDYLAATTSPGTAVETSGALPPGVALVTEERDGTLYVYLRGITEAAGVYTFALRIGEASYTRTITVNPAIPTVTASADVRCYPNESVQVSVSASADDGGSLSYQWYTNTVRDNTGGAAIAGAASPAYQPGTAYVGTSYYYCVVSNVGPGVSSSATSPAIAVTVEELSVDSIAVASLPSRVQYTVGETLSTAGLSLRVRYSNGSEQILSEGFGVYPTRLDTAGTQRIEISYQGRVCDFTVTVEAAPELIEGIGVLSLPVQTTYTVGESLDVSGLAIRVYTNNGHRDVTDELLICEPLLLDTAGTQTITVFYGGKSCTFSVTVLEEERVTNITLSRAPDKLSYRVGETLDTTGMVLRLIGSQGTDREITTGFTCSPTRLETAGRQEITVRYGELSTRFFVTVTDAPGASPSPASTPAVSQLPVPTVEPGVPDLTATADPHVTPHESHDTGLGRSLVGVVVIAALLALSVLGVYVYIANRGGVETALNKLRRLLDRLRKK